LPVDLLYPVRGPVSLEELPSYLKVGYPTEPFHPSVVDVCVEVSQGILRSRELRRFPELTVLAFWMRKAEIQRLRDEFASLGREDRILVPRGTVLHLPPRNVDTMFVYSWLLSALTGNQNVIRLSPLRSESTNVLLDVFRRALAGAAEPARSSTMIVSYGHEPEPTELLSSLCDVRVIWGGDQTVTSIRRFPLPPHARELTFPDRYSLAAIQIDAYRQLDSDGRDRLADQFFNDSYWFDQAGCSSPRLLVWCGDPSQATETSDDFFPRLAACVRRRQYPLSAAQSMQKLVFSASAILDRAITACIRLPEVTVLRLASLDKFDRRHPGGGLFYEAHIHDLGELAPMLQRRDQTLAYFGFDAVQLRSFITSLNGRALDRVVPIGQALQFGRFWDGHDLLQEFCRHVYLGARGNIEN
jgi:hypothetical protein